MGFKEYTPEQWFDELEKGLEYRRRFALEDLWSRLEAIYYGVDQSMVNDGPNILLSQGDSMMSMLSVPSPVVKVSPLSPESVQRAPVVEALDNMLLEELDICSEVEQSFLHAYLYGTGFVKIGYDSEWGYDPKQDLGGNLQLGLTLSQLDKKGRRQIEYNANVQPGMPWVQSVLPHDIVVPWGVRTLEEAPWIAHRLVRHIDDLRADPKYERTRYLQPQMSMRDFVDSYRASIRRDRQYTRYSTEEAEYVELYEIHDRRTGKILAITWDHSGFLRNDINLLQISNRLPFAAISFTPTVRSIWTTPDAYYLLHIQNELSDIALQRTKQRRIAGLKFLYDADSITDEELLKILSPDVGVAAKVESGRDISKAIQKIESSPNILLIQEEETVRGNAREQIGFSRNQLGEYTGGRKTAAEVNAVDRSSQLRMSRRGLKAKRLYRDIFRIVNEVVFRHWTLNRYIHYLGPEDVEFYQINGPSMAGRYKYKVEFVDEQETSSRGLQALQLYGSLAQDPSVDPIGLRQYLVNAVGDPAFGRLFNASIRSSVSQVSNNDGRVLPQGPNGTSPVQRLQDQSGQTNQPNPAGLLARGRNSP